MMILKNIQQITMTACCGIFLWGCNQTENIIPETSNTPIAFNASDNWVSSRLVTNANGKSTFQAGDAIGIFCYYNPEGNQTAGLPNYMYNQKATLNENEDYWEYLPVRYWPANSTDRLNFTAYYPYNAGVTGEIVVKKEDDAVLFEVNPTYNTDLLMTEPKDYEREPKTLLQFKHLLAKVKVNMRHLSDDPAITSGMNDLYIKKIIFNDYPTSKTFKLTSGALTEEISQKENYTITDEGFSGKIEKEYTTVLSERFVWAGQLNNLSIILASGNILEPEIALPVNIHIEGGQIVTLNITVSMTGINVDVVTNWEEGVDTDLTI